MIKPITTLVAIFISLSALAQTSDAVLLRWKPQPKEVISYKVSMNEMDTASAQKIKFDFGSLGKLMGDSSSNNDKEMAKIATEMKDLQRDQHYVATLAKNSRNFFDVELRNVPKPETPAAKNDTGKNPVAAMMKMMSAMNSGVMMRGAINNDGSVRSFYLKSDQRNMLALLFELPVKAVKVGDSWPLDVHLVSMDQNFKCDTSYKRNVVTLIDLKKVDGQTIAVLKYDILEYVSGDFNNPFSQSQVKTSMKFDNTGFAEFSIEKGRWVSFNCILSMHTSGIMDSNSTQAIKLLTDQPR